MTILMTEGFDHESGADGADFATLGWSSIAGLNSGNNVAGRFVGFAAGSQSSSPNAWTYSGPHSVINSGVTTLFVGFAEAFTFVNDDLELSFLDTGSAQVTLKFDSITGTITAYRGTTSGAVLGGVTSAYQSRTYQYIEVKIVIDNSVGVVQVKIEGATVLNLTGQNTKATANASFNGVAWNNLGGGAFDDLYMDSAAFHGPRRVTTLYAVAAGSHTQWMPLASTNVSQVSETKEDRDASYNSSSTVGQVDTFLVTPLPANATTIDGVALKVLARKDDAPARSVSTHIKSGATEADGATNALTTSYACYVDRFDTDPNTAVAWTPSGVNAMEIGYKEAA